MKRRILSRALAVWLFAACVCLPFPLVAAADRELDVVVNKTNGVNTLSIDDVRRIFKGEKTVWRGGKRIRILMLAPGATERAVVLRELYRMTEADYTKYFLQAAFNGKIQAPPKDLDSEAQMKQFLAANPGAIGYLWKNDVDNSVRVVLRLP